MKYQTGLEGKQVTLIYKPTAKSKWHIGYINLSYSLVTFDYAKALAKQESYYDWKFVKGAVFSRHELPIDN